MDGRGCVSEAELRTFLLGELPQPAGRGVSSHLESCGACGEAARRLAGLTDPAIRALRQALRLPGDTLEDNPPPAAVPPNGPPCGVPGYDILKELGRGGMSVVYQAWQAQ